MLLPHYRLWNGSQLKWLWLMARGSSLCTAQLVQHGFHFRKGVLVASAAGAVDALLQHSFRFILSFGACERLRRHEVSVRVIRMGGEQKLKLGECGVGFASARIFQPKRITCKGIIRISVEDLFQRRHAVFVGHGAGSPILMQRSTKRIDYFNLKIFLAGIEVL